MRGAVVEAQRALNRIAGRVMVPENGEASEEMRQLLLQFQEARRLPATGTITPPTLRALQQEASRAWPRPQLS